MQKAILTGFKLTQDPKAYTDKNGRKYFLFAVCAIRPGRNGNHLSCECCVRDLYMVQKVDKLKLHQGSCVDLSAEISAYTDKSGNARICYEVSELSIADYSEFTSKPAETDKTPEQKHAEQNQIVSEKTNELLDLLNKKSFSFV